MQESRPSSAPESSVDESVEPVDTPPDDDDEEALYARARRRYASVNGTSEIEPDTPDDDASSDQAKTSNLDA